MFVWLRRSLTLTRWGLLISFHFICMVLELVVPYTLAQSMALHQSIAPNTLWLTIRFWYQVTVLHNRWMAIDFERNLENSSTEKAWQTERRSMSFGALRSSESTKYWFFMSDPNSLWFLVFRYISSMYIIICFLRGNIYWSKKNILFV